MQFFISPAWVYLLSMFVVPICAGWHEQFSRSQSHIRKPYRQQSENAVFIFVQLCLLQFTIFLGYFYHSFNKYLSNTYYLVMTELVKYIILSVFSDFYNSTGSILLQASFSKVHTIPTCTRILEI